MLDLTKHISNYYEIKWFDGEVYHLKTPTQALLMEVVNLEKIEDIEEQFVGMSNIIEKIFNNNRENKVFSKDELEQLDLATIEIILEDYLNSINQQLGE